MWEQTVPALFGLALTGGILCGVFWDISKIIRIFLGISDFPDINGKYKKRIDFVFLFVQDVFFCMIFGCVLCVVMYYGNEGRLRALAPVGMLLGFWAYRQTLGALVIMTAEKAFSILRKAGRKILVLFRNFASKIKLACIKTRDKIKEKLPNKVATNNKEAVEIEKNQNCKVVGDKGRGKRAFYKSQPHSPRQRKRSARQSERKRKLGSGEVGARTLVGKY